MRENFPLQKSAKYPHYYGRWSTSTGSNHTTENVIIQCIQNNYSANSFTQSFKIKRKILVILLDIFMTAEAMKCGLSIPLLITIQNKILLHFWAKLFLKNESSTDYKSTHSYLPN